MNKIPPSEWPKYNLTSECSACGSADTSDNFIADGGNTVGDHIQRFCSGCAWKAVWAAEKVLVEARKALVVIPQGLVPVN